MSNDPDEVDLADEDLRDERSREDYLADQADNKIKQMKEDGSYWRWRNSRLTHAEFVRDENEREFEAAAQATFVKALDNLREAVDACDRFEVGTSEARLVAGVRAALAEWDASRVPCQEPERSALVDGGDR